MYGFGGPNHQNRILKRPYFKNTRYNGEVNRNMPIYRPRVRTFKKTLNTNTYYFQSDVGEYGLIIFKYYDIFQTLKGLILQKSAFFSIFNMFKGAAICKDASGSVFFTSVNGGNVVKTETRKTRKTRKISDFEEIFDLFMVNKGHK